jgi:hypothetical protein
MTQSLRIPKGKVATMPSFLISFSIGSR